MVLYAEVTATEGFEKASGRIQLSPLATLAGRFDAAYMGEIEALATIGIPVSAIAKVPAKGTKVIVILNRVMNKPDHLEYQIPNASIDALPIIGQGRRPAIVEVTSFDDPKVTETIENLRKLRGQQARRSRKSRRRKSESGKNPTTPPAPAAGK